MKGSAQLLEWPGIDIRPFDAFADTAVPMLALKADRAPILADDPVSVAVLPVGIPAGPHGAPVGADLREAELVDIAYVDSASLQELHRLEVIKASGAEMNVIHQGDAKTLRLGVGGLGFFNRLKGFCGNVHVLLMMRSDG